MKLSLLVTDYFLYFYIVLIAIFIHKSLKDKRVYYRWVSVFSSPIRIFSVAIIFLYLLIGLADSIHFREALPGSIDGTVDYSPESISILDRILDKRAKESETSYSSPFAMVAFVPDLVVEEDGVKWESAKLSHISDTPISIEVIFEKFMCAIFFIGVFFIPILWFLKKVDKLSKPSKLAFSIFYITAVSFLFLILLSQEYHVLGTDKVGKDVFYLSIKGVRTGLLIGIITTTITVPIAVVLGMISGYCRGWIDDVVQYVYSTVSSVPGVLLISASVLSLQLWLEKHQDLLSGYSGRIELRLLLICFVLGITGWPGLCRLIRAETLKIRELGYIEAAKALNVGKKSILFCHILPNLMYIILISVVMDMSGLVLAESVLSYVGVGVDPSAYSWGNMINSARMELGRTPAIWWSLLGAFISMFLFVVSINIIADAIRDIYDPRVTVK